MKSSIVLECIDLHKTYATGPQQIDILSGVSLSVAAGENIGIIGASGSGKSTLLNLLGTLDECSQGQIFLQGVDLSQVSEKEKNRLRNEKLGFVYQFHHLLDEFSALENCMMPLLIGQHSIKAAREKAEKILAQVGLEARLSHKPPELSGGERQRVAIARALVNEPVLVFMDEPTGNLDNQTAQRIHELIVELSETGQTSFIVVTHDELWARRMQRTYRLQDGRLLAQTQDSGSLTAAVGGAENSLEKASTPPSFLS